MKIFLTLTLSLLLVACTKSAVPATDDRLPVSVPGETVEVENQNDMLLPPAEEAVADDSNDPTEVEDEGDQFVVASGKIVLYDFEERRMIESPLELSGKVRRDWLFEGSFPITIMTLEEKIIAEWYGTAEWLEPLVEGSELSGDDMIEFDAEIEFTAPEGGDMGKIRFAKDLVGDDAVAETVETMILWQQ